METLHLLCDSIATLTNSPSTIICQPIIEKAETNCYNYGITDKICGTLVLIAGIAAITIVIWKLISFWAESSKAKRERKNTVEDVKREQIAAYRKKELELLEENKAKINKLNTYIQDLQKP